MLRVSSADLSHRLGDLFVVLVLFNFALQFSFDIGLLNVCATIVLR